MNLGAKKLVKMGMMGLLATMIYGGAALAGEAKCNDGRTIAREAGRSFSDYVCYNEPAVRQAQQDSVKEAEFDAHERLAKFDVECRDHAKGVIVEEFNRPETRASLLWHYRTETYCHHDHHGHQHCRTEQIPTYRSCEIYAKASVRHLCSCK